MATLHDVPTPALVVDLDRLDRNLGAMQKRADDLGVRLRPHVKTHKCVEIGRLQLDAGARGITVATLHEAEVFATAGFDDILWAFPLIPSRIDQALALAERVRLGLTVDSAEAVRLLAERGHEVDVWVKVDCGYHRCGVDPAGGDVAELVRRIGSGGLRFAGLLSHSGDAYDEAERAGRAAVAERERRCLTDLAGALRRQGVEVPALSVGSTPGMTAVEDLAGITEARPGNYAYFDRTQLELGSCGYEECALTVVSTVVSVSAGHAVIDAGALALSKDAGPGDGSYGTVCTDLGGAALEERLYVAGLSQEHGRLSAAIPYGSRLRVLPNHSCLTAACFTHVYAARGLDVLDRWRVWNGR